MLMGALHATAFAQEPSRATVSAALNYSALQPGQQAVLAVVLEVAPGFHAQSHTPHDANLIKTEVKLDDTPGIEAFEASYPPGRDETYPQLGTINVYTGKSIVYVPLQVKSDAPLGLVHIKGTIAYQICDDKACFAPEDTPFSIDTQIVPAGQAVKPNQPELFAAFDPSVFSRLAKPVAAPSGPRVEIFGKNLDEASWTFIFFAAFVIGMIFNIVPCVLPVVPLKAIGFYEVSQHNRAKCLALGLVFSLGLIASFAVLGLLVLVWKRFAWGEQFSNPWFLAAIVMILAVMAFGMFGMFGVGLPNWIYNVTPRHNTYSGNFLFGILAAVLSTPCTFGMFLGLMIWAVRQPSAIGMGLMITVGAGMAFPYLVLSAFPNLARNFPRSGPWSELVKQMMGFLLLASAVYFARRFIVSGVGDKVFWWMLFAVVLSAGVFLVARTSRFAKSWIGPVVATVVALLFVAPTMAFVWRVTNPPIDWKPYSEQVLADARKTGKPVVVEFTADWCGNCLALETSVFHSERAVESFRKHEVIPLRADLSKSEAPGWKLLRQISPVGAIPLTAIYPPNGNDPHQLSGIYTTDELVQALDQAAAGSTATALLPSNR